MDSESATSETERILEVELRASLVDGRLPCAAAFKISGKHGVSIRKVGDMANRLNVQISSCQLGCFP